MFRDIYKIFKENKFKKSVTNVRRKKKKHLFLNLAVSILFAMNVLN